MKMTLTEKVRNAVKEEFINGVPQADSSIPTEKELAKRFGVSLITVRRAVESLVQEGLLVKRQGKGTFLAAAFPAEPLSIGVLVPGEKMEIYSRLSLFIEPVLRRLGHQVRLFVERDAASLLEFFMQEPRGIDGLIVCGYVFRYRKLKSLRIPVVFAGTEDLMDGDCVLFDLKSGAYKAVSHLLGLGHRRIAFLSHLAVDDRLARRIKEDYRFERSSRFMGYREALEDAGIPLDESLVLYASDSKKAACQAMKSFLSQGSEPDFSALFASTDIQAEGALQALEERGLAVPGRISVIGCDNLRSEDEQLLPLTTLDLRLEEVAEKAARLLLDRMDDRGSDESRCLSLAPRLLVRGTSSAFRAFS